MVAGAGFEPTTWVMSLQQSLRICTDFVWCAAVSIGTFRTNPLIPLRFHCKSGCDHFIPLKPTPSGSVTRASKKVLQVSVRKSCPSLTLRSSLSQEIATPAFERAQFSDDAAAPERLGAGLRFFPVGGTLALLRWVEPNRGPDEQSGFGPAAGG